MPRQSTIKKLPPEIRDTIGQLLDAGHTLDEIVAHLSTLGVDVSRSALGRHKLTLDKVSERIRRSREIAEAMVRNFGDAPESKTARLNIELMHGIILDILSQLPDGVESADAGEDEGGVPLMLAFSPRDAMELAKGLDHLARASKQDADLLAKLKEEARAEARKEMARRVADLGGAADLKNLSDEELEERIAALAEG